MPKACGNAGGGAAAWFLEWVTQNLTMRNAMAFPEDATLASRFADDRFTRRTNHTTGLGAAGLQHGKFIGREVMHKACRASATCSADHSSPRLT